MTKHFIMNCVPIILNTIIINCYSKIKDTFFAYGSDHRHSANGLGVANLLESHPKVIKVHHPELLCHSGYELFKKQRKGYSGLLSFQM